MIHYQPDQSCVTTFFARLSNPTHTQWKHTMYIFVIDFPRFLIFFPSSLDIFGIQCSRVLSITYGPSSQLWANGLPRMNDIDIWKTGAAQGGTGCAIPQKTCFFLLFVGNFQSKFTFHKRKKATWFPSVHHKTTSQHWGLQFFRKFVCIWLGGGWHAKRIQHNHLTK